MPYIINKTNGARITVVQDGTIDTTTLDITLVGKNYTGYGETFNENFVKLLEHFANTTPPIKPLVGGIWYDSARRKLRMYSPTSQSGIDTLPWKELGIVATSENRPSGYNAGDLWFKPSERRLYAYTGVGADWQLIGPLTSRASVSGAIAATIKDEAGSDKDVVKLITDGQDIFVSSRVDFSVNSSDDVFSDFPIVKQGLTFPKLVGASAGISYSINSGGTILWGTAASAVGLVKADGGYVLADDYIARTELESFNQTISIAADDGILLGLQGVLRLHVTDSNTGNVTVLSQGTNPPILKFNVGSASANVLTLTSSTVANQYNVLPNSTATVYLGTTSTPFNYIFANTVTATTISGTAVGGTTVRDNGNRVLSSVIINTGAGISGAGTINGPSGALTIANTGVLSLTGTANKISVSGPTGNITLNLPQEIHTEAEVTFATINGATIRGTQIFDNTSRVLTVATIAANAVRNIAGTANQVSVTSSQGDVTVSLPQNIHTGASPTFNGLTLSSLSADSDGSQINGAWTLSSGATFQATFADLAERYHADAEYQPGTVLVIGGEFEVTTTTRHGDTARAGIVSTNPAYTLNAEAGKDNTHPYIALAGRVPCKVIGPVTKGDLLVTSTVQGFAERAHSNDNPNATIARALESFEGTEGIIEVMVV
jgi:hypothetical protein